MKSLRLLDQIQRRFAKDGHLAGRSRFQVAAEHGLRARGTKHYPATVFQQEFIAVLGDDVPDFLPAERIQPFLKSLQELFLSFRGHEQIDAVTDDPAGPRLYLLQDAAKRPVLVRDQFGHQQARENSVLFRYMPLYAQATAF